MTKLVSHINYDSFPSSKIYPNKKTVLIISQPGLYILDHNIIVGSSSAGDDVQNILDFGRQVSAPPFHFGIWAAISIECDDVTIDLNGHSISMTDNFAMQQRFFSLIELANQPFPKDGGGFIAELKPANNVTIKNGILDNSSHHGIHGNANKNVYLENLTISNFEVAGIAINTGYNINIKNCVIDGTSTKIKVLATFAMVQDLKDSLLKIINDEQFEFYKESAKEYLTNEYLQHILENPGTDDYDITVNKPVNSGQQVLDGNLFGIYFNNVFSVGELTNCGKKTDKINIEDVCIKNILGNAHEVTAICENNVPYKDNKGYLIRYDYLFNKNGYLKNFKTPKEKAELFIVRLQLFCLNVLKGKTTLLNEHLIGDFLDTSLTYKKIGVEPLGGFDSRAHILKGNFGLRIDSASNININKLNIVNVSNYGKQAPLRNKTEYTKIPIGLGGLGNETKVYKGNSIFGLSLSNCEYVKVKNSAIQKCKSDNGFAIGATLLNNTNNCNFNNIDINNLKGNKKLTYDSKYNIYIDPTSYSNNVILSEKKEVVDAEKNNKLLYNCEKCDKLHKI